MSFNLNQRFTVEYSDTLLNQVHNFSTAVNRGFGLHSARGYSRKVLPRARSALPLRGNALLDSGMKQITRLFLPYLERYLQPEPDSAVATILHRRIGEACRESYNASILEERVDGGVVRMIKGVHHAHVEVNTNALAPVGGLGQLEVRRIGHRVTQAVAARGAERRAVDGLGLKCVQNKVLLIGSDCIGRLAGTGVQGSVVVQCVWSGAANGCVSEERARICCVDAYGVSRSRTITQERSCCVGTRVEAGQKLLIADVERTQRVSREELHRSVGLPGLQNVAARNRPSSKRVSEDAVLTFKGRDRFVERQRPALWEIQTRKAMFFIRDVERVL